jgi:hypothetical protein
MVRQMNSSVLTIPWGNDEKEMALTVLFSLNDGFDRVDITSDGEVMFRWFARERDENGIVTALGGERVE